MCYFEPYNVCIRIGGDTSWMLCSLKDVSVCNEYYRHEALYEFIFFTSHRRSRADV